MNDWQLCRQVRYLLQQAKWEDGSTPVFAPSSIIITAAPTEQALADRRTPIAVIVPAIAQIDPEFSADVVHLVRQEVRVTIVTATMGDALGENAVLGGNRAGFNTSANRGLLEIGEKVRDALLRVDDDDGVRLSLFAASAAGAQPGTSLGYVAYREYVFIGRVTTQRSYRAPRAMTATGGSGEVALTFSLPATRFDTSHLVLRRASGSTAPSSVTGGTGVTLGSNLPTSFTDTGLAAGTYSYALFMAYDEFGDGTNFRYSPAVVQEAVTVTAGAGHFDGGHFSGGHFSGQHFQGAA